MFFFLSVNTFIFTIWHGVQIYILNILLQECTNPGCLVARAAKFCAVRLNIVSVIIASPLTYKNVYQFTRTEHKASDIFEGDRSVQSCASSVWNLLHVTLWGVVF